MKRTTIQGVAILLLFAFSVWLVSLVGIGFGRDNLAAVFSVDNVTPQELQDKGRLASTDSQAQKIRIFIMPGHEPDFGGTEYRKLKERDINIEIATELRDFLHKDGAYDVVLGRDASGWDPRLKEYLDKNVKEIDAWRADQARIMRQLVSEGEIEAKTDGVPHSSAPKDVANRLFGINKWVSETYFDLVIHIHINDYGSRRFDRPGEFTGYSIYVPDRQYSNAAAARQVAESISSRLDDFVAQSDLKKESGGVVEDQELVAVGRYNTVDVPSVLIEYGYIYEPQFQDADVRKAVVREYAYQTYLGLREFFSSGIARTGALPTVTLPYEFKKDIRESSSYSTDIFALQMALAQARAYPAKGRTLNDCPISGYFGACTKNALTAFQAAKGITGEKGYAGENTRAVLNY
ncbi:MAG TPA: N-acetylmuramoyl-L-alanine amidase [Candidatus Paceibacterota bacterium]